MTWDVIHYVFHTIILVMVCHDWVVDGAMTVEVFIALFDQVAMMNHGHKALQDVKWSIKVLTPLWPAPEIYVFQNGCVESPGWRVQNGVILPSGWEI